MLQKKSFSLVAACSLTFLFLLCSCKSFNTDQKLEHILNKAGSNKSELLKVLEHYSKKSDDSLKLKAAYFLIENIDQMKTLDTNSVRSNNIYFDFLNTIKAPTYKVFSIATKGIDSINAALTAPPRRPRASYIDELENVSSDFLIRNIDSAFYVWQNMPWAKHVSFEDFCEYILPYRCTATYSTDIRDFFLTKYKALPDSIKSSTNMYEVGRYIINDVSSWFVEDVFFLPRYPFLKPVKFSDLLKGRIGACDDANSVRVAALRALGVATAFDQIPNWGNDNLPHFWYKIIDKKNDTTKFKITNENIDRSTQHLISASTFDVAYYPGTPSNVQVNFNRTVPKVYRRCFSKQKNSLAWIGENEEIPAFFTDIRLKDVTTEYLETATVNLSLPPSSLNRKFVYLCVFDNQKWLPVAWSTLKNGKAEFKEMGKNIVYLPAYYENGEVVPADNPFLLDLKGNLNVIKASKKTETVKLFTKFPVRSYVVLWESYMLGSRFQLANKADFSDSVTVHTVTKLPFYETEVKVKQHGKFRYLIYQFKRQKESWGDGWISELEFYGLNKNGQEIKLTGTPVGNTGEYPDTVGKLFDGILYNVYKPNLSASDRFIGIDLGADNPSRITKIKYMPYTDDNAVKSNDTFELFYWNNNWESLGTSKAAGVKYVLFKNIPRSALLLLINKAGGVQQRIFTYQNQKQIFW